MSDSQFDFVTFLKAISLRLVIKKSALFSIIASKLFTWKLNIVSLRFLCEIAGHFAKWKTALRHINRLILILCCWLLKKTLATTTNLNKPESVHDVRHKDWLTYYSGTDRSGELCYIFSISNGHLLVMFLSQLPLSFHHIHNEMSCFIALLMTISVLIGTVFVIIWEMFHGRIS